MKFFSIVFLLVLAYNQNYSQSLEGEWKGKFEFAQNGFSSSQPYKTNGTILFNLKFLLNADGNYDVYSFTKGLNSKSEDTIIVCKLSSQFSKDSIYLEETGIVEPKQFIRLCFKKMFLKIKIKKKFMELNGTWKCAANDASSSGTIYFWKKND